MSTEYGEQTVIKFNSVAIPQVSSISGPSYSQSGIETDYMGATVKKQRASGKLEPGEVKVSFVYDSDQTGQTDLVTALTSGTEADLSVIFSTDGTVNDTWTCKSFVSSFELSADDDADVTGDVTFQLMDTPTIS